MKFSFCFIFLVTLSAPCQTAHPAESADALIREAVARYSANQKLAYAFTYNELWINKNFNDKGDPLSLESAEFESVFIDDLPYLRKIAEDGEPLTDGAARHEEKKYEEAVKARRGMTLEQKQAEMRVKNFTFPFKLNLLPTLYDNRIVGPDTVNGRAAVHIDCVPKTGVMPANKEQTEALSVHVQVWIDVQDGIFSRVDGAAILPVNGLLPGSTASIIYAPMNGVWLPLRVNIRGQLKSGKSTASFNTELAYSNFQKFSVDVRVMDGDTKAPANN
jgi:hypothetical protein